ncbi:MAG: 30S ribosomal protein S11 [Candidatus Raymondbacteria bacterium RifOxyA12_full_50_37]|uniref:Small ribosomal subunit protein uS11 n=1 Tax=Candidatus Raymondbacteria bacterium RIFOXYD12_FULL_49_13 TaxID=1817890 RepID=A0A1F7FDB3_UNCRA|nr:MAG: 30S ribosomal protein S11 [Candidatus Raymondbacteria bacterium RifOxyA12_full_50_37]OGJ94077.1 MAG: 30S ribosomal protein S11 [Candidatus Raymondbacteria bacterium RIFOXYA2_FULL_49_16]OGJ96832.1 MAG: 30S ribosomal protein S11 [Candidatus Raymondbacteria bacterium RifOxyC12_full_50_8]OGJ96902.1 MAG: 30S ribosomal protein S11 [Candidatus Raymondbacteria bacterium RIFOXYC2_FULL_50_21]OGK01508.1 MAG: 30S ribosomal protein S11 [Candidatus Raymondbacteria bacterium RifOxyB12_full_50_8]OGK04
MTTTVTQKKEVKKTKKRVEVAGVAHIRATFNNTIISIANPNGEVVAWASSGRAGFKGSRKSMPYAATVAAEGVAKAALDAGMKKVDVHIRGGGAGRESAVRALKAAGLEILSLKDFTAIPHNGCRRPKRRRI